VAVSKRLRYEVLRRDNHACRYCGASAPEAKLTVDHVVPVTLGGTDDPSNLVTACEPCNSGKSATPADSPIVADVAADALRWAAAMRQATETLEADVRQRAEAQDRFLKAWNGWKWGEFGTREFPLPSDWRQSLDSFLAAGLPESVIAECIDIACGARHIHPEKAFRYMCGVAWKKVSELREIAGALLEADSEVAGAILGTELDGGDYVAPPFSSLCPVCCRPRHGDRAC
jgi:hypothetical protein